MMLRNSITDGATSLLRCYVRYAPGSLGKALLFNRILRPFFNWRHYSSVVKTNFGAKIAVKLPDLIQSRLFFFGVWEPQLTNFITKNLKSGDCFIDVGSNIGYFSLLASSIVGNNGKVFAIEASPSIHALLDQNIKLNNFTNIRSVNVAAADFNGTLNIYLADEGNIGHSTTLANIAETDGHKLEAVVPAMPLADIVGIENLINARIIKIDVEGAEASVIKGIRRHLSKFSSKTEWVIEITPDGTQEKAAEICQLLQDFKNAGYHLFKLTNDYEIQAYIAPPSSYSLSAVPEFNTTFDLLASKQIQDPLFIAQQVGYELSAVAA